MFQRLDPFGNPNVGVYVRATDTHLFVPPGLTEPEVATLEKVFGLEAITTTIGGSTLVGSLCVANSHGAVVADFASDHEMEAFSNAGLQVSRLRHARLNAAGNNILANDKGALVHSNLSDRDMEAVAKTLDVPVVRASFGEVTTVGTAASATNRGVLAHPLSTEDELAFIKANMHVPASIGTVNHGHGLVGAGMAANQRGVVCGGRTTGIELGRIEEALLEEQE